MQVVWFLWMVSLLFGLNILHLRSYGFNIPLKFAVIPAVIFGVLVVIYH